MIKDLCRYVEKLIPMGDRIIFSNLEQKESLSKATPFLLDAAWRYILK